MKHLLFFRNAFVAALLLCCNMQSASAQMQLPPIPTDPNVRIGKLDNGLTYYIRHNALPEKRAEFYIAQKVGAIQEEPNQRGLAHFLEHMAFNGTKNFPGNEKGLGIVQWCESKGIKFGRDLNAYTSVDETVYNISNAPIENEAVLDSCLLILHDWSNALLLSGDEIDKERGVIHEEWRSRNVGIMRLYSESLPTLFPDSKYADCMPIGTLEVIDNFPYDRIRNYYHKWYRPDLQGIVIVGDVDVDQVESKIKATWADVPAPVNPAKRAYYPIPDNKEPLVYIGKDKEIDEPMLMLFFKQDATPDSIKGNMMYMLGEYMLDMATDMLTARLDELRQTATPPFISASCSYGNYFLGKTKEALGMDASCKADGIETALQTVLTELERARRFGFTESEYERARANYLQQLESAFNEREKSKHSSYVREYVRHFLDAEPIPGIEFEYNTMNQVAPNLPVAAINQTFQQMLAQEENAAVFIAAVDDEKASCPTRERVLELLKQVRSMELKPYEDKVSNEPLMSEAPQGGSIVSEKSDGIYGTTELTLSNGVKVVLKKTDFKADEIRMSAYSFGGTSLYEDKELLNASYITGVTSSGGLGSHNKVELDKLLAGKKVSVSTSVGSLNEFVSGFSSPKDFETLMQLTYLTFTAPHRDDEAFASFKNRVKAQLESAKANPLSSLNDTASVVLFGNHPRALVVQPEMIDQLDYNRILEMYHERFADADDFRFFFVGNIDMEKAKPLIAQYIGALPSLKSSETFVDRKMEIVKGNVNKEYAKKLQTPMATNLMVYSGACEYNLTNWIKQSALTQILNIIYTEEIREKEGGTYGVSCYANLEKNPRNQLLLQIVYQTDPAKKEYLNKRICDLFDELAAQGPSEELLKKVKEYMIKQYNDNQKENNYWLQNLLDYYFLNIDKTVGYVEAVNGLTTQDIRQFAADFLKQGNKATIILTAEEEK